MATESAASLASEQEKTTNTPPFHVAVESNNRFAIKLVQGKLSLDEILGGFAKCNKEVPLLDLLDYVHEPLLVSLHRDVVGTVCKYLGLERPVKPKKRMREEEESCWGGWS